MITKTGFKRFRNFTIWKQRFKLSAEIKKMKKGKFVASLKLCFKFSTIFLAVAILSCLLVTVYHAITTCQYFTIDAIVIENAKQLSRQELLKHAKIKEGDNIFAINIAKAGIRLDSHPWIAKAGSGGNCREKSL